MEDAPPPQVPQSLLERLRADPARAPEYIALAASERHGPAAARWVAEQGPGADPARLARSAKKTHARMARTSGAVTGIGGILTVLPDMAAAVWIQSRVVFFVAAAYGFDPVDRMRPAELLVLYDLYEDPVAAREALDGVGRSLAVAAVERALSRDDERSLTERLAQMALRRGATRVARRAVPGLAIITNAVGNEKVLRDMADRAIAFYGG